MNVFATDPCPSVSARALADRHVVKMPIEAAQILASALHLRGCKDSRFYAPTHTSHPCVGWAHDSDDALAWLLEHGFALCNEYTHRYGKIHKAEGQLETLAEWILPFAGTPDRWVLAMPETIRGTDRVVDAPTAHAAYRAYLASKYATWGTDARWTRRDAPKWAIPH